MAKPNYRFDKRQRELAQQKKREEKRLKKQARDAAKEAPGEAGEPATPSPNADDPASPLIR